MKRLRVKPALLQLSKFIQYFAKNYRITKVKILGKNDNSTDG